MSVWDESGKIRYHDDAIRNPDGTLTPVEVKSDTGHRDARQRDFDTAFNASTTPYTGVGKDKGAKFVGPVRDIRID